MISGLAFESVGRAEDRAETAILRWIALGLVVYHLT